MSGAGDQGKKPKVCCLSTFSSLHFFAPRALSLTGALDLHLDKVCVQCQQRHVLIGFQGRKELIRGNPSPIESQ
jgi:hypothetical protein